MRKNEKRLSKARTPSFVIEEKTKSKLNTIDPGYCNGRPTDCVDYESSVCDDSLFTRRTTDSGKSQMQNEVNQFGQPVGFDVSDWKSPPLPRRETMCGRFCCLEPLNPDRHADDLYTANSLDSEGRNWTYLPYGPFDSLDDYQSWLEQSAATQDPLFFAIKDLTTEKFVGVASYLRIDPKHGSIEVGHLCFSPLLQAKPAATEAMYLMMERAFQLGYRRYEWKCHSLNAPSRRAAQRLGLSFEGVFRQAGIFKGRNRDTAWYAAIDQEWPDLQLAFRKWLAPENFDTDGRQRISLSQLTSDILKQRG